MPIISSTNQLQLRKFIRHGKMDCLSMILDPDFDPKTTIQNRDPRFYHDIVFDGFKYVNTTMPADQEFMRYTPTLHRWYHAQRSECKPERVILQKLVLTTNKYDGAYNWSGSLRLSSIYTIDIYLMYTWSLYQFGGATIKSNNFTKTGRRLSIPFAKEKCWKLNAKYCRQNKMMDRVKDVL